MTKRGAGWHVTGSAFFDLWKINKNVLETFGTPELEV